MSKRKEPPPYTVERIFNNFSSHRAALIRAVTKDQDGLFRQCNPDNGAMCLYGHINRKWEVRSRDPNILPGQPEPKLGINLVRDNMERQEWLRLIAMYCDAWLINFAFFLGPHLDAGKRKRLFNMINGVSTVHEEFLECHTYRCVTVKRSLLVVDEDITDNSTKSTICTYCGDRYRANAIWITCDVVQNSYHGKCVRIKSIQKEYTKQYECPECKSDKKGNKYNLDSILSDPFKWY